MSEVRVEHVSKRFKKIEAVRELSFTVRNGQFVVLLGPTGAGKTTTLRLIAGLERPDQGRIFIDERDVTDLQPAERDVAFVFQQYSLYPRYTVYDNLAFPLRSPLRKLDRQRIDRIVRQVAETLHITDKLRNKATQLSGGEMQRVAIGRALVRAPNIFLMDEPLSSLDAKLREELRLELKNIQLDLGATILFVTHDYIEAMTMADRIGILQRGSLAQFDTPDNVYNDPASIYVARKLGSPKINVLPARLFDARIPPGTRFIAFRPENVMLGGRALFQARIETIQNLGVEQIVTLSYHGESIRALTKPGTLLEPNARIAVDVPAALMLFFDDHEMRIYP